MTDLYKILHKIIWIFRKIKVRYFYRHEFTFTGEDQIADKTMQGVKWCSDNIGENTKGWGYYHTFEYVHVSVGVNAIRIKEVKFKFKSKEQLTFFQLGCALNQ